MLDTNMTDRRSLNRGIIIRIKVGCEIGLYKSALRALGCPTNIHFWWNENKKALFVSAANEITDMSIPVHKDYYNYMNGLKISNKQLLRAIQMLFNWEDGAEKKIRGNFIPELKMIEFKANGKVTEVLSNV